MYSYKVLIRVINGDAYFIDQKGKLHVEHALAYDSPYGDWESKILRVFKFTDSGDIEDTVLNASILFCAGTNTPANTYVFHHVDINNIYLKTSTHMNRLDCEEYGIKPLFGDYFLGMPTWDAYYMIAIDENLLDPQEPTIFVDMTL